MHYVRCSQKAIVSCLPKAARGPTLHSVLSLRPSPGLQRHAVTPQTDRKYQRGLSSDGTGSAKPGGDALEPLKAAIPTTGSTRGANRSNTKAQDGDSALESLRAAMPAARSPSQPGPSATAPDGDSALQSLLSSMPKSKPTTSQSQPSAIFGRKRHDNRAEKRIKGVAMTEQSWHNKSDQELLEQLKNAASELQLRECDVLARYMIWQRGYKPDREMYTSLILANGHTDGSSATVRSLLDQMKQQNISLDTAECLTVLKVLAVHPDYVLRARIIEHMERGWHGLSESSHHLIIAGMLRGLQLEQAVDELESMVRNGIVVATWLYDMAIAVLVNVGELEEALRVMRMRLENAGPEGLNPIWTFMLEAAAESFNYTVAQYVWKRCVTTEYINPTSGTCRHVMNMAARKGDVALATDAFRILHKHHGFASLEHYEMLFEAQIDAGDTEGALRLLCEMHADGHTPNHASTRPLYMWLMDNPAVNPADYFHKVLAKFEVQGLAVPIAAANVLIEACAVRHADRWADALRMYERVREVCAAGPDVTTFYHMFDLCRAMRSVSWPHRLAAEYAAMALPPDAVVLDGVVGASLHARAPLDAALAHRDAAAGEGVRPLQRTLVALYRALRAARHPRAAEVEEQLGAVLTRAGAARVRAAGDRAEEAGWAPSPWEDEEGAALASVYPPDGASEMEGFFREMGDRVIEERVDGSDLLERSLFGDPAEHVEDGPGQKAGAVETVGI